MNNSIVKMTLETQSKHNWKVPMRTQTTNDNKTYKQYGLSCLSYKPGISTITAKSFGFGIK